MWPDTVTHAEAAPGDGWSAGERQEAARNAYLASVEAGTPLTGAELGRQFGRTDRWGRMQIRKFRAELDSGGPDGNGQARGHDSAVPPGTDPPAASAQQSAAAPASRRQGARPPVAASDRNRVVPLVTASGQPVGREPDGNRGASRPELPASERAEPAGSAGSPPAEEAAAPPGPEDGSAERSRPWLDSLVTLAVAVVCAAASFGHMYHVALLAGEPVWIARAWPVTVDGLVLAALRRGPEGRWWLALGIAVSMAANVLAQFPELAETAGPFVSAWPPVALYGTHRLLHGPRQRPSG